MIRRVRTKTGAEMPVLGLGTWRMGEDPARRRSEVDALRLGLDLGMTLVDTAEMYAGGEAERIVAEAIRGRREEVFLVSKVLPQNATRDGAILAAERSLERLRTDRLDLYLLHWPGSHPVRETLAGFRALVEQGKILHYGVSNFDRDELATLEPLPGADRIASNQVLYNLERRGIENLLIPWCNDRGIVIMAYSPIEQGRLRQRPGLVKAARRHGVSPECLAIAWTVREPGFVAIPKAANRAHVRENAKAAALCLSADDLEELDRSYPRPPDRTALEIF